jgi:hypothetical protein
MGSGLGMVDSAMVDSDTKLASAKIMETKWIPRKLDGDNERLLINNQRMDSIVPVPDTGTFVAYRRGIEK